MRRLISCFLLNITNMASNTNLRRQIRTFTTLRYTISSNLCTTTSTKLRHNQTRFDQLFCYFSYFFGFQFSICVRDLNSTRTSSCISSLNYFQSRRERFTFLLYLFFRKTQSWYKIQVTSTIIWDNFLCLIPSLKIPTRAYSTKMYTKRNKILSK